MGAVGTAPLAGARDRPAPRAWARPGWVAPGATLVAAGAAAVVFAGDVVARPTSFALFSAYNVLAFGAAATLWLRLRPRSGFGMLLFVLTAIVAVQSLQGASAAVLHSLGVLADPFAALLAWYALLAFPSTRLTRGAKAVLSVAVVGVVVGFVPWFFLSPHVAGGTPLARCTSACPENAFMLAGRPDVAAHFGTVEELLVVAFVATFLALVTVRLIAATLPRRRVLAPVYAVGAFWLAAFGAYNAAAYLVVTDPSVYETLAWVLTGARVALPLAFVLSLLLARDFAGRALERVLQQLGTRPGAAELERALRRALGDPAIRLTIWRDDGWADVAGEPAGAPAPGTSSRLLRSDGLPVAQLRYDSGLDADPELVDAAATAVLLSLERGLILSELHRSERRVAAAGEVERRRLERNLHDSAQQRLVALRIRMALVQEQLVDDPAGAGAELEQLGGEVDRVLDELRSLARGVDPPTLREEGIAVALADAVRTHPRARLARCTLGRYPADVEAVLYFSALEALQNASKHAGRGAEVVVSAWEEGGQLRFEVRDDGPGFDPDAVPAGGGLAGVDERLRGFAGTFEIHSAPGRGTRVLGAVPLPA